ncbi:hypothetical protein JVU11DRAFT_11577 [Chiua virens]|nr:hypothetical protein JVU11DRAFT_11577 [Chiua virens]
MTGEMLLHAISLRCQTNLVHVFSLKEAIIAQGIEFQRRWIREVKVKVDVEEERGGRLARLNELATGLKRLERLALDNSSYLDENIRVHGMWTALHARLLHEADSASHSMHTDPSKSRGIMNDDEDDDLRYIIHWPDGIDVDTMKLKDVVFNSVEENRRNIRIATRKKDYDSIKKVINALQSCPPAWPLGSESRKDTPSKSRAVRAELDAPLREIVKILTDSAYEHREKSFNLSLDVDVSLMPKQDWFEFEFKQRQDSDDEDDEDVIDDEQDTDDKLDLKHKWTTFLFPPSKPRKPIEKLIEALGVSLPTGGNDNADDTTGIDTMHEDDPLSQTVLVPPSTQANPAAITVPLDDPASGHMPVCIHQSALDDNNDTNDDDDESMYWKDIDTASGGLVRTQPIDDEGT